MTDGNPFVNDLTIEPLRDQAGTVVAITCASLDVIGQQGEEQTDSRTNETSSSKK